ncbi:hypothetical protein FKM82_030018, partial [Ascaphus truei]
MLPTSETHKFFYRGFLDVLGGDLWGFGFLSTCLVFPSGYRGYFMSTSSSLLLPPEEEGEKIDIGLPFASPSFAKMARARKQKLKENHRDPDLERASRLRTLRIPLDEVRADWERTSGPYHVQRVADHYGVYRDLFGEATFTPRISLRVQYSQGEELVMPVYHGNVVTASEAAVPPEVTFEAEEGSLWTLLLTNP